MSGRPQRQIYAETYYPRFHFGWSDLHSLIDGNEHYIHAPQPELYDLAASYVRLRQAMEPREHEVPAPSSIDRAQFPKLLNAYSSLVMLLATERKLDAATKVVFDAIKASPEPHTYVIVAETPKAIGDDRGAQYWAYQGLQRYTN